MSYLDKRSSLLLKNRNLYQIYNFGTGMYSTISRVHLSKSHDIQQNGTQHNDTQNNDI